MTQQIKRKNVVLTEEEAVSHIKDGMTIALGGFSVANHPMPIVRQIIKKGIKNLTVIGAATAGLSVDMLLGAGCVKKLIAPYVGAESYCSIGNCFRKAIENNEVENWECSEYTQYAGLMAQAMGMGFMIFRGGLGSSLPDLNPDFKEIIDPFEGDQYLAIPAIEVDWAILHVGIADIYGNGQHLGCRFGDRLFAQAANRVMIVTEKIVDNSVIRRNPYMTSIEYADIVVEAPFASHPFAAHGSYEEDAEHIKEYVEASKAFRKGNDGPFKAYLDKYVYGPKDNYEYLELFGLRRLFELKKAYENLPVYKPGE